MKIQKRCRQYLKAKHKYYDKKRRMAARYQGFKRVLFTINAAAEVVNKLIEINRIIRASQPRPKRNFPLGAPAIVGGPVSVSLGPEAIINKPELAILKL